MSVLRLMDLLARRPSERTIATPFKLVWGAVMQTRPTHQITRDVASQLDNEYDLFKMLFGVCTCPDCKDHPVQLYEGPSGGLSSNMFCRNCGHGYNVTPGTLGRAYDIGVNLSYCDNVQVKARRALEQKFAPPDAATR